MSKKTVRDRARRGGAKERARQEICMHTCKTRDCHPERDRYAERRAMMRFVESLRRCSAEALSEVEGAQPRDPGVGLLAHADAKHFLDVVFSRAAWIQPRRMKPKRIRSSR